MVVLIFFGLILVSIAHIGFAQSGTDVIGIINQNATWTNASSPYVLTGPLAVNSGVTLTVEPGATVNVGAYSIQVNGTLIAKGTSIDQVNFNGGQITFTSVSNGWNNQTDSGCIIENAVLNTTSVTINNASPKIDNSILGQIGVSGGTPTITGNNINGTVHINYGAPQIVNNTITGDGLFYGGSGGPSPSIINNTIFNCQSGIALDNGYILISGNHIFGCQIGINAYSITGFAGDSNPIPSVQNNLINNNSVGIRVYVYNRWFTANFDMQIMNNTISKNSIGLSIYESSYSSGPTILNNNFVDNTNYSISLAPGSATAININATYNWWGTSDTQLINQAIYDFKDDSGLGNLTFVPFLTAPNPQTMPNSTMSFSLPTPSASVTPTSAPTPSQTPTPTVTPSPTAAPSELSPTPTAASASPSAVPTTVLSPSPSENPTQPSASSQLGLYEVITGLVGVVVVLVAVIVALTFKKRH